MKKQIDEMAREFCSICHGRHKCENPGPCAMAEIVTEGLYNAGYRKQSENTIELPCKVGQTIFFYTCVCDKEGEEKFDILEGEVISFSIHKEGLFAYCRYKCGLTYWHLVREDFCKTVFLTKEEAEAKMRGEQKCG